MRGRCAADKLVGNTFAPAIGAALAERVDGRVAHDDLVEMGGDVLDRSDECRCDFLSMHARRELKEKEKTTKTQKIDIFNFFIGVKS